MNLNEKILAVIGLLSDGEFHSGEELGEVLGVTRAAVWKQVQALESLGVKLESVRGKGYRIEDGVDLLDQKAIHSKLTDSTKEKLSHLELVPELASTNQYLLDKLNTSGGLSSAHICMSEMQTAGRGRRGRTWQSPFAKNIYFSCVWHFENGVAGMEGLSLAVGVAIVRALEKIGLKKASLKWPNDILVEQAKLGGVLIEIAGDVAGDCDAVIGVGLNVSMPEEAMTEVDQPWVSLSQCVSRATDRNGIAAALINCLFEVMKEFERGGFAALKNEWESYCTHLGKGVSLQTPSESFEGRMLGVSESGSLRLEVNGEEKEFLGGEVSLRAR